MTETLVQPITPCIWFDHEAEDAANFYVSLFPNSAILNVSHYPDGSDHAGKALTVEFKINGQVFTALNGGPDHPLTDAISFQITCRDQAEQDRLWDELAGNGGQEVACGWVTDRYGLSWQVIPAGFDEIMNNPDPEASKRAFEAMMKMKKLDLPALQAAAAG